MDFYLSAAHKSSGKTSLSIGLIRALCKRGYDVQSFKKGPDYIDPIWLSEASNKPCRNLDFYTMSDIEIRRDFDIHLTDIRLIEGNKGLHDGLSLDGSDSNAMLAAMLGLPVFLVIDCTGITRGIAPMLLGFKQFEQPKVHIQGVILNKVGGSRHESKLIAACEHYTDIPVIGSIHKNKALNIDERHLGLIPSTELKQTQSIFNELENAVCQGVDLTAFLQKNSCRTASGMTNNTIDPIPVRYLKKTLRIGIARDSAFGFYYASDLERFEQMGAQLIFFSPLHDAQLPKKVDGLFLGGGFPETSVADLSANQSMLNDLNKQIKNGLPTYAECGGLMILSQRIHYQNESHPMAAVIESDCTMHQSPQGRGYVELLPQATHLWGMPNSPVKAHEFHYSALDNPPTTSFAYTLSRGEGINAQKDGFQVYNLLASYSHLKHTEQSPWVDAFLRYCQEINYQLHNA